MKTDAFTRGALVDALFNFSEAVMTEHFSLPPEGRVVGLVTYLRNGKAEVLRVKLDAELIPWDEAKDEPKWA